jgi:hypothetical protein
MNHPTTQPDGGLTRLDELLCDRAVFGLDTDETAELARLLRERDKGDRAAYDPTAYDPTAFDVAAFDMAAAELVLGGVRPSEPVPAALRARVLARAEALDFTASRVEVAGRVNGQPASMWFALAASLLLAAWIGRLSGGELARPEPSVLQSRAELAESEGVVTVAWSATDDRAARAPEGADRAQHAWGDVVWSDARQQGYMKFRGLAENDPNVEQYQLWVFDAQRDDRYPVDGGVFNIAYEPGADEAIVPIRTKLPVNKAVMFAVTVEKPGGVVVSDRSRLPLLAKR